MDSVGPLGPAWLPWDRSAKDGAVVTLVEFERDQALLRLALRLLPSGVDALSKGMSDVTRATGSPLLRAVRASASDEVDPVGFCLRGPECQRSKSATESLTRRLLHTAAVRNWSNLPRASTCLCFRAERSSRRAFSTGLSTAAPSPKTKAPHARFAFLTPSSV